MIPLKIRKALEKSDLLISQIQGKDDASWNDFTRTTFNRIARIINDKVTHEVIDKPFLVDDMLLFGDDEFQNILFRNNFSSTADFLQMLQSLNPQRPYSWISGKTLQSYWHGSNAKEKKLHVLLTFLEVDVTDWDKWKQFEPKELNASIKSENSSLRVIAENFAGCYYRYYQKTDKSKMLIKTPFIITGNATEGVNIYTKTIGHKYKSNYTTIRDGAWYVECENVDWNEKESFIFNVGFQINPKVIMGVSNTLDRAGNATAIKNILVKQESAFDYDQVNGLEMPFDALEGLSDEEQHLVNYFSHSNDNIIQSSNCSNLKDLPVDADGALNFG